MKIIWKCTWAEFVHVHVDLEWLISYGNLITEILPVILQNEGTKVHNSQHSIHMPCIVIMWYMYSRRQKNVSIFNRRTVKVRSVPFPFYGYRLPKR